MCSCYSNNSLIERGKKYFFVKVLGVCDRHNLKVFILKIIRVMIFSAKTLSESCEDTTSGYALIKLSDETFV